MNIQDFLVEVQEKEILDNNKLGAKLNQDKYIRVIDDAINSPYLETIEQTLLDPTHDLFPFSKNIETISSALLQEAIYYHKKHPESELTRCMQKVYLEKLAENITSSKNILYKNIYTILQVKLEKILEYEDQKTTINRLNNMPYENDEIKKIKILDKQFELEKPGRELITWFKSTLITTESTPLRYEVQDLRYSTTQARQFTEQKFVLELQSFSTHNHKCE